MDEFELAGFDEETCERLRELSEESGVAPCHLISAIRGQQPDMQLLSDELQLMSAWYRFKKELWDEFKKSRIGKFMFWLADKLNTWLEK